jgi:hypothetical protein
VLQRLKRIQGDPDRTLAVLLRIEALGPDVVTELLDAAAQEPHDQSGPDHGG